MAGTVAMLRAFSDLESTEGLKIGEKLWLDYDHIWQLTVTLFEQQQLKRCLLVFISLRTRISNVANC